MSTIINYGPVSTVLEKDAEGYAFSCPLCHQLFFSSGTLVICQRLLQEHLQQHHRMCHCPSEVIESVEQPEPPKLKTAS